jgi:dihydrofolate reductase
MRKIIVTVHSTLDGFMSGPAGDENNMVSWAMPGIQDTTQIVQDSFDSVDTILLGRVTYEGLAQFWPTASGEFADKMNLTPKLVASKKGGLDHVEWGTYDNISLIKENVEEELKKLKEQPGKDIMIFASSKLVQSLTNAGLIDEYRIIVHPVILGSGKRLLENIEGRHDLQLKGATPYESGAILLQYVVAKK